MSKPPRFNRVTMSMLTHNLEVCFGDEPPKGDEGRQEIRDLVMRLYECTADTATRVVEHLEHEGYIRCGRSRRKRRRKNAGRKSRAKWRFEPNAGHRRVTS